MLIPYKLQEHCGHQQVLPGIWRGDVSIWMVCINARLTDEVNDDADTLTTVGKMPGS